MAKKVKAGWYPDPERPGHERQWDGDQWTGESRLAAPVVEKKKAGRKFLTIVGAIIVALILLIGGCTALLSIGLNAEEEGGITRAQFNAIAQGTTQRAVEAKLGEPEDSQKFETQIPEIQRQPLRWSCIYYPEKGKSILEGASFQLCFDEGRLTSKNAF